jgi:hypothetical protein
LACLGLLGDHTTQLSLDPVNLVRDLFITVLVQVNAAKLNCVPCIHPQMLELVDHRLAVLEVTLTDALD